MSVIEDRMAQTRYLKECDPEIIQQVIEIEKAGFEDGGLHNEWLLVPFIRYGRVYIMEKDSQVIAAAQFMQKWDSISEIYFYGISVHPELRGKGVGTAFINEMLADLRKDGIKRVVLSVNPNNQRALKLYENRFGFTKIELCKNEYGPGEHRYIMELFL